MNTTQKTSVSLILRVANQRDLDAWQDFLVIYQPLVYRIAIGKGLQPADAEDLVQEVLTRVAKSVGRWDPSDGQGTFRGWISTIARNLVIDFLRKSSRIPRTSDKSDIRRLVESTADPGDESRYFDREYERQLFINAANDIRGRFADNTWAAFWRTAVKNESVESVARALSMSSGAVYVARSRVMARLKEKIQSIQNAEVQDD